METNLNYKQNVSTLLDEDENDSILRLLGPKCQSLSTTVIQLFNTRSPESTQWYQEEFGVLCLIRDARKKSYYFRLYCPMRNQLLWEHEVYYYLQYLSPAKFFHCFEAEESIIGFNFASEEEAFEFENAVTNLQNKRNIRLKQISNSYNSQNYESQPTGINTNEDKPQDIPNNKIHKKQKKKNKGKKKITKDQIGFPTNFEHKVHVGRDPELDKFYTKANISKKDLRNHHTRSIIDNFVEQHGMDAIKKEVQQFSTPTVSPSRPQLPLPPYVSDDITKDVRPSLVPPMLPPRNQLPLPLSNDDSFFPLPPPPPLPPQHMESPKVNHSTSFPPLPDMSDIGYEPIRSDDPFFPLPPPPLLPTTTFPSIPTRQMELPNANNPIEVMDNVSDARSALLESIKHGTTLKPIKSLDSGKDSDPMSSNSKTTLLDQIRQGIQLKSVQQSNQKTNPYPNNSKGDSLAESLLLALQNQKKFIQSDSDSDDSSSDFSDDEDWDD